MWKMKAMIRERRMAMTDNVIADSLPRMPTSYGQTAIAATFRSIIHPVKMGDILRGVGSGALLIDRPQVRPESSRFPLLLIDHPSMEPSQRQEKQDEAEQDQPGQKSTDAEDLRRRGRPRRT